MNSLANFSQFEIGNTEEIKGGIFSCFNPCGVLSTTTALVSGVKSLLTTCYTPSTYACNTSSYSNTCAPVNYCTPKVRFSFSFGC